MTAQTPTFRALAAGLLLDHVNSLVGRLFLSGGPRVQGGRGAHQVVRDDAEPDPASGAVGTTVATAPQAMPSCDHTDAPLAPDAPALSAAEPSLAFVRPSRRRLPSGPRHNDPSPPALHRRLFVPSQGKAPIARGDVRGTVEQRHVSIQRGRPQRHVGRPSRVDFVGGSESPCWP